MPNVLRFIALFLLITHITFGQEKMILDNQKTIPSTEMWTFDCENYSYSGNLQVQIGNNLKGGTLLVQVKTSDSTFYIGGTVYLFLEDGNVITCTDKNKHSIDGKMIQSYYVLTPTEINLLQKNKLTDVRFRINGNATQFSSPTGFFTAHNKIRSFGLPDKTYDTVLAIKQLFN